MDNSNAIDAFAALAQPTRLDAFRLLVQSEPEGMAAGEIARGLNVPHNTMSTHLALLTRAGLISSEKRSRSVVYRVDLTAVRGLVTFLLKDCCGGNAALCAPLIADLMPCCPPSEAAHA